MYHQYWTKGPIAGLGGDATQCPAGQVGYPPLCYAIPPGVDPGTEPQGSAVCPPTTPYGTPPWCYAIPGVQPPPAVEPVAGGMCPADMPYGVYPVCFSAASVPQGTPLPPMPIPGATPGLPSVTEPGKEIPGSEQKAPVAAEAAPWTTEKKLLVGGLAVGGAALLYFVMKKKAPSFAR